MLQRPHFLPKDKPSSVAQTAHCVRIIPQVGQPVGVGLALFIAIALLGLLLPSLAKRAAPACLRPEAVLGLTHWDRGGLRSTGGG